MTQKDVFHWFGLYFPQFTEHVEIWFPNGKNSVRIRQTNGTEYIFSYEGKTDWKLESIDSFLKNKERRKLE